MTVIEKLMDELKSDEGIFVFSEVSRHYLTKFRSSDGVLFITRSSVKLYLDSRYEEAGKILKSKKKIPEIIEILPYNRYVESFSEEIKKVFFEDKKITVFELNALKNRFGDKEFLPLGSKIEKYRMIKTPDEIEKVRISQKTAEAAFTEILNFISPDKTEMEVAAMIEFLMKKNGATGTSFETICVSGKNSSMPHGVPSNEKLVKDSFITLDFGCVVDGYCSDMTRTVCLGHADEEMKSVYNTVLCAQKNALKMIRAGLLGSEIDYAARSIIENAGYGKNFGHSLGHGVGLEVHESPAFSPAYKYAIPENSILSVEPGIYLEGKFGVRIEDLVVVTENGCENINSVTKELIEI